MIVWLGIGLVLAALAAVAPLRWAAAIVVFCVPFSGTVVWMLGGDPLLLPLVVCAAFIARHAASLLDQRRLDEFLGILRSDWALVAFVAYCIVSGLIFPRLFAGETLVIGQLGGVPQPLGGWLISLPQIAYVVAGAWTYLALRHTALRVGLEYILGAILLQIAFIGGLGFVQALLGAAHVQIPLRWIVNNTGYAMMADVLENGFVRVTSVFMETSAFAQWGAGAFAFCYALYVGGIAPRISLALSGVVGVALMLSTSSSAYAGLAIVGAFGFIHAILDADKRRRERAIVMLAAAGLAAGVGAIFVFTAQDGFLDSLRRMVEDMTVHKAASASGVERLSWITRSVTNAVETGFLGVGYGVARSSGLFPLLLGVMGIPGLVLFILAFWPRVIAAFRPIRIGADAVAGAASFGLVGALGAMSFTASEIALQNMFWVFAAVAGARLAVPAQAKDAQPQAQAAPA